jgi:DNA-binding CsgD family transcriptional regulator
MPPLTRQERRVLERVAAGLTAAGAADELGVSRQAVAYHLGNLHAKLQVGNRAALVARAYVLGLLDRDSWPPRLAGVG